MAHIYDTPSRTFGEFLLIPNLTTRDCSPDNVSLLAPLVRFKATPGNGPPDTSQSPLTINVPVTSALMQSVSSDELSIALARCGGLSFVFGSQSIEQQAAMVRRVKNLQGRLRRQRLQPAPRRPRWPTCWRSPPAPATRPSPSPRTARRPAS